MVKYCDEESEAFQLEAISEEEIDDNQIFKNHKIKQQKKLNTLQRINHFIDYSKRNLFQ